MVGGFVLVMSRSDIGARGGGERGRLCARHYLVWVVNDEGEVGERTETLEAAFIGVVGVDWTVVHLLFHEGKAADLGGDGGDGFKGCLKALADVSC
jgi:hypothetical protein